jgi:hypothetical protein
MNITHAIYSVVTAIMVHFRHMEEYQPPEVRSFEQEESYARFIGAISADELRVALRDLADDERLRPQIIAQLAAENPDLLLEVNRQEDPELVENAPELAHSHSSLLDSFVILAVIRKRRAQHDSLEELAKSLWPDKKAA